MSTGGEETLWGAGLAEFRDATASAEPTPGGGSVAGVSATLGLGLVIMALEISAKRKDAVRPEEAHALIAEARTLMDALGGDADADIRAFRAYMAALKLPRQSEEEKGRRKEALQAASRGATESPLLAARHMVAGLRLARNAVPLTHSHVISDVGAGTALLEGALKAVLFNVDVNLPSLADAEIKAAFGAERVALAGEGAELATEVLAMVARSLAGEAPERPGV
jgi:formiminotetrahydrofolate cyclodeaminase